VPNPNRRIVLAVAKPKVIQRRTDPTVLAWRMASGLSQREAASILGMTQATYSRLELGRTVPRRAALQRVLDRTGVPLDVLVGVA
jgi:transcriptional regulator with XRE-family HTH domain